MLILALRSFDAALPALVRRFLPLAVEHLLTQNAGAVALALIMLAIWSTRFEFEPARRDGHGPPSEDASKEGFNAVFVSAGMTAC